MIRERIELKPPAAAYITMDVAATALASVGPLSSVTNRVGLGKLLSKVADVRVGNMRLISVTSFLNEYPFTAERLLEFVQVVETETDRPAVVWI